MRKRWFFLALVAVVTAGFLFAVAPVTAAEQDHNHMKVGKTGDMSFTTEHKFGGFTLPPGQYSFRHEAGNEHAVVFSRQGTRSVQPGGVKCTLEPLRETASATAVTSSNENGELRITRIVIRGENVAHVFN